jgi:hypothetical protein
MPSSPSADSWRALLTLDAQRNIVSGSPLELRAALARGADLRIYSEFRHNEHIDTTSSNDELVRETMDMRATYLIDDRWAAGICTLRQPVELPLDFGPRPSLSLFLYNEDGKQAIARPYLDGPPLSGERGPSAVVDHHEMPKYHELDRSDSATNAPSSNFVYDFDTIRYFVRDDWQLVLHHTSNGEVVSGSRADVVDLFASGVEWKLGIVNLCADLVPHGKTVIPHQAFIQAGACYLYSRECLLIAASHPLARVRPAIPLRYETNAWDYTWLITRTDGHVARLVYDPYTLQTSRGKGHYEIRWFCR